MLMAKGKLSSETLFNFTDTLERLIDNLNHGIYCNYTYEKLPSSSNGYYIHMACFCDIPLSMTSEHFDWYGRYGIGIKRSYARDHGVRPVWYLTSENPIIRSIIAECKIGKANRQLIPFLKKYYGKQPHEIKQKDGTIVKTDKYKKFYDEREWRYVPPESKLEPLIGVKHGSLINLMLHKDPLRMPLELDSIEYIIIASNTDMAAILTELRRIASKNNYSYETLVTKLITSRQIDKDF
jgi:hypothetical protein